MALTLLTDVLDEVWVECLVGCFIALAVFESYFDELRGALEAVSKAGENLGLALCVTSELLLTVCSTCTEEGLSGFVFGDLCSFEDEWVLVLYCLVRLTKWLDFSNDVLDHSLLLAECIFLALQRELKLANVEAKSIRSFREICSFDVEYLLVLSNFQVKVVNFQCQCLDRGITLLLELVSLVKSGL